MPSESTPKRLQEALKAPKDPPDPPSPTKRKNGPDETPSVQDATNTPSRVDERPQTPVNKPTSTPPAHPTSPSSPSTPTNPTNLTNPTTPTNPPPHVSPSALLSSPSPLRRTLATPSTRRVTRSSSAISDLNAALSSTSEVTRLTPSRSTGETLPQQPLFVPGAASPAPANSAGTRTRAAAKSQPNAIGRSYANAAKQAHPTTSAARQRDSSGTQPQFSFVFGTDQQPPQDKTPIAPALAVDRGNCLAISVPRDTTPLEIAIAIAKCDERLPGLTRPFKDPKGRMLIQVKPRGNAQDILTQLQSLPLNVRGVKPQIHACYNSQNKFLQEGLLVNFEDDDGVEEEFRKQVEASGDRVIFFQRQFHPRAPNSLTGRIRVLLDLSGSKTIPGANAFTQQFPDWVNHNVIFKPVQAGAAKNSPSQPASTYCYYCHSSEHARPECPTAPECSGCGSRAHPSTRCPGRPKANLPASARAPTGGPPHRPVEPGPDLDGYQLVHKSKRRSLNRPTEATTEMTTPPAHADSSHSHSEQAPRNADSQPIRTLSALEEDNEGGMARTEDGMQVEDEHPPSTPPPLSPSSPPPPSPSPPSSIPLNPPSTPSLISSTPSSQASIERTLVTLAEAEDMEE